MVSLIVILQYKAKISRVVKLWIHDDSFKYFEVRQESGFCECVLRFLGLSAHLNGLNQFLEVLLLLISDDDLHEYLRQLLGMFDVFCL